MPPRCVLPRRRTARAAKNEVPDSTEALALLRSGGRDGAPVGSLRPLPWTLRGEGRVGAAGEEATRGRATSEWGERGRRSWDRRVRVVDRNGGRGDVPGGEGTSRTMPARMKEVERGAT